MALTQVDFDDSEEKKIKDCSDDWKTNKPKTVKKIVKEFRDFSIEKTIGETITCEIFTEGEKVDVVGTSKGKGFQGVVKRHGFSGVGEQSHGQHDRQRAPGSIGNSSDASRVFKGMRMAGRMGGDRVKAKSLKVLRIFSDKNYILVSGSVPGHNGSIVLIQK
jgi:large subunit ribosomal protein L3